MGMLWHGKPANLNQANGKPGKALESLESLESQKARKPGKKPPGKWKAGKLWEA